MFSQPIAVYEPMSKVKKEAIQKRVEARLSGVIVSPDVYEEKARGLISEDEIVMSIGRIAEQFQEDVNALHVAITGATTND